MDPYALGQLVVPVVIGMLVAWLIIRSVVRVVRFNLIKKRDGVEAAQQYWKEKNKKKTPPSH